MIELGETFSFPFVCLYVASILMCLYTAFCELFERAVSENVLFLFLGFGLVFHAFLGGIGWLNFSDPSLMYSVLGIFSGAILYLPFLKFYKKKYTFFFFWISLGAILGPFHFLYVYFYTCLVCALLSILLIIKKSVHNKKNNAEKKEGLGGMQAPYYISSVFGVLFTWLSW